jgi:hypothetical protein
LWIAGLVARVLVALPLMETAAAAQRGIDPRCVRMRDPGGCDCALKNGGWLTAEGGWATRRSNGATNEAFVRCMAGRGRS